jgi:hypothetical protein
MKNIAPMLQRISGPIFRPALSPLSIRIQLHGLFYYDCDEEGFFFFFSSSTPTPLCNVSSSGSLRKKLSRPAVERPVMFGWCVGNGPFNKTTRVGPMIKELTRWYTYVNSVSTGYIKISIDVYRIESGNHFFVLTNGESNILKSRDQHYNT